MALSARFTFDVDFTGPILQVLQVIPVQSMSVMFFHSRSPNQFQLQIHFSELSEVTYRIVEHQTGGVVSWSVDDRTANHLLVDFSIPSFVSILGSIPYNP